MAHKQAGGLRLPTQAEAITPDVLGELISAMHPGTRVESFDVLDAQGVGGMVSTAGRAQLQLRYAAGSPPLPERVISKMIIGQKSIAPTCMFETEVAIYQRILPDLPIEKPVCLAAVFEPDTENFMLLLEDISVRGARFTNILEPPLSPAEVGALLDRLAVLHAQFWESPVLERESAWLSSLTAGRQFDTFENGFLVSLMDANVAESPYRQDFVARAGRTPAQLWELVKAVHRHQANTMPLTLCHGDTGAHNTFRLPDGGCGFLDWQLSVKAAWPHDVHYLICTGLSVRDRRIHERALVERYLERLAAQGVGYRLDLDQAMAEYSLAILWGLTIGWFSVPKSMYGMEIISANIERLFAAATDHDIFNRAEKLL